MKREQALNYVSCGVDDAAHIYDAGAARTQAPHARLVGWQCGFEPVFVAVWSYLPGVRLDDDSAAELAMDALSERNWFDGEPTEPDYIL